MKSAATLRKTGWHGTAHGSHFCKNESHKMKGGGVTTAAKPHAADSE
jgi:hypothetical protein